MEVFDAIVQVRRYVYHDVVRLGDLEKLVDCSNIQVGQMQFFSRKYKNFCLSPQNKIK